MFVLALYSIATFLRKRDRLLFLFVHVRPSSVNIEIGLIHSFFPFTEDNFSKNEIVLFFARNCWCRYEQRTKKTSVFEMGQRIVTTRRKRHAAASLLYGV